MNQNRIANILTLIVAALVLAIGAGAFVLSYEALRQTGLAGGIPPALGWLWPLLIDAPLVVFTLALLVSQIMRQSAKLWAGLVILYTLATVGFNLTHAQPSPLGWTVAVVAPAGLLLTTEALRHLARGIIERAAAIQTLAELTADLDRQRLELAELQTASVTATTEAERQIADLTTRRDAIRIELEALRKEKRRETTTAPAETSPDVYQAARAILAERGPEISGSELGRLLGKSESLGRRLKRELTESAEGSSETATLEQGSAFDRIVSAAIENGKPGIADILTTAKRGWDRANGHAPEGMQ